MKQDYFAQAKVTVRKQIAIPKKVREKLGGVEEGDYLLFYEEGGRIYVEKGVLVLKSR
ncbi:MAG: AbrB/MazE/SpoVT family DNA-binding domain-containing protein [Candidatus Hydrothermarchaeales archaeon]